MENLLTIIFNHSSFMSFIFYVIKYSLKKLQPIFFPKTQLTDLYGIFISILVDFLFFKLFLKVKSYIRQLLLTKKNLKKDKLAIFKICLTNQKILYFLIILKMSVFLAKVLYQTCSYVLYTF